MSTNGLMHISGTRRRIVHVDGSCALLEWERRGRYFEDDVTGRYRVSAARMWKRWRFSAWHKTADGWERLGTWGTAAEAKAACERHKSERQQHDRHV